VTDKKPMSEGLKAAFRALKPPPPLAEPLATAFYDFAIAVGAMKYPPKVEKRLFDLLGEMRAVASEAPQ
jgi:hypothetical protein